MAAKDSNREKFSQEEGKKSGKKKYTKPRLTKHGILSIVEGDWSQVVIPEAA